MPVFFELFEYLRLAYYSITLSHCFPVVQVIAFQRDFKEQRRQHFRQLGRKLCFNFMLFPLVLSDFVLRPEKKTKRPSPLSAPSENVTMPLTRACI